VTRNTEIGDVDEFPAGNSSTSPISNRQSDFHFLLGEFGFVPVLERQRLLERSIREDTSATDSGSYCA
jgi:hypothetical protein